MNDESILAKKIRGYKNREVKKREIKKYAPLTMAQKSLWFLEELYPESASYNIYDAVRIMGNLDTDILEKSLNEMIKRHEILRTVYIDKDRNILQNIQEFEYRKMHVETIEKNTNIEELLFNLSAKPFDLKNKFLFDFKTFKMNSDDHILFVNFHHSILDGWALNIFWDELIDIYNFLINGEKIKLEDINFQYADYAMWEKEQLNNKVVKNQIEYWKRELKGYKNTYINYDKLPLENNQNISGSVVTNSISDELKNSILTFCDENDCTMYQFMLAGFMTLLSRYTRSKDLIIGTSVLGRNKKDFENILGYFVNTVCVRMDVNKNENFKLTIQNIKNKLYDIFDNQLIPFEKVVEAVKPDRKFGKNPLFNIMFTFNTLREEKEKNFLNCRKEDINIHNKSSKYDLTIAIDHSERTDISIEYNAGYYYRNSIERFLKNYIHILEAALKEPDVSIKNLQLSNSKIQDEELNLNNNNNYHSKYNNYCLHQIVEKVSAEHPYRAAIQINNLEYTYAQLNNEANILAEKMLNYDLDQESYIGVYLPRSKNLIVSILAILKTGKAYVPIDITSPKERISHIIKEANLKYIISNGDLLNEDNDVIEVNIHRELTENLYFSENIQKTVSDNDPAYIIFTSGSTGKPKGVVISHSNVVNLITQQKFNLNLKEDENILQFASIGFDASVWEIFTALSNGFKLCLLPNDLKNIGTDLAEILRNYKITTAMLSPSLLSVIDPHDLPEIRTLISIGEKCLPKVLEKWCGKVELWNGYGPTEATVLTTVHKFHDNDNENIIGKPLNNVNCYVLDENSTPVAKGVEGDLYIGGKGVSLGYIDELQNENKFLKNPFSCDESLLYKSGDVAKILEDGSLQYINRKDNQVQIKGFRVELGEIENILLDVKGIDQAAVKYWEKNRQLVAYIVTGFDFTSKDEINRFLQEKLPYYMIPNKMYILKQLPYNQSGKIDRKLLPEIETENSNSTNDKPKNNTEKIISSVISYNLNCKVNMQDDFFELGGDSLMILKVINELKGRGIYLSPKNFYQSPIIKNLSTLANNKETVLVNERKDYEGIFDLSPIQLWFFESNLTDMNHWNFSLMFDVNKDIGIEELKEALEFLNKKNSSLRLKFKKIDNSIKQYFSNENLKVVIEDSRELTDEEFVDKCNKYQGSLNIFAGDLIKAVVFKRNDKNNLLLVVHHLLVDWISADVIYEDLRNYLNQKSSVIKSESNSYKDWVIKLNEFAKTEYLEDEYINYWKALKNIEYIPLPIDYKNKINNRGSFNNKTLKIKKVPMKALAHKLYRLYGIRVHEIILAACLSSVLDWKDGNSIVVDVDNHGREDIINGIDINRTVGWFTSIYPYFFKKNEKSIIKYDVEQIVDICKKIKKVPNNGISHGIIKYLSNTSDYEIPNSEILFNYFGKEYASEDMVKDYKIRWSEDTTGKQNSDNQERKHLFEIIVLENENYIEVNWGYSENIHSENTIKYLLGEIEQYLSALFSHYIDEVGKYE